MKRIPCEDCGRSHQWPEAKRRCTARAIRNADIARKLRELDAAGIVKCPARGCFKRRGH